MTNEKFVLIVAAALTLLCGNAMAQSNNLISCASAGSLNIYNSINVLNSTTWYEVARSPSSSDNCVAVDFSFDSTSLLLNINITSANNTNNLSQNETVQLNTVVYPAGGVSFPYTVFYPGGHPVTYKFLLINSNNAVLCGYNPSNTSDSFGLVLSSTRDVTQSQVQSIVSGISLSYANFQNLNLIDQSSSCYTPSDNNDDDNVENKYYFFGVVRKSLNGKNPFQNFPNLDPSN